jgi:hypothetical protein
MEQITLDELLELTRQDRISRKPLMDRLAEFANGDPERIKGILFRCDYSIMSHKNENDCQIIKDTVEEVLAGLSK